MLLFALRNFCPLSLSSQAPPVSSPPMAALQEHWSPEQHLRSYVAIATIAQMEIHADLQFLRPTVPPHLIDFPNQRDRAPQSSSLAAALPLLLQLVSSGWEKLTQNRLPGPVLSLQLLAGGQGQDQGQVHRDLIKHRLPHV